MLNTTQCLTLCFNVRLNFFQELLIKNPDINLSRLRSICFESGIPDDSNYRSLAWKILLGYLGTDKSEWESTLIKKRSIYKNFVDELVLSDPLQNQVDDHPLNPNPTSQWNVYFKDNEILSQIFKDVRRLYPDISFFQQKIPKTFTRKSCDATSSSESSNNSSSSTNNKASPKSSNTSKKPSVSDCDIIGRPSLTTAQSMDIIRSTFGGLRVRDSRFSSTKSSTSSFDDDDLYEDLSHDVNMLASTLETEEYHWQVVARILFIYAKLNPGQGYVQGMNEIVGPLYYVFCHDTQNDSLFVGHSEADTFWCFTGLMSEIRDMYNSQLDADRSTGVVAMMTKLTNLLSSEDPELYHKLLQVQGIKPHYYAFRWITLLLSQEFPLPEVLRIWDFLFSDADRFNFLICFCCSMLMLLKSDLMEGDFATNMKLLQSFPVDRFDVSCITRRAKLLMNAFTTKSANNSVEQ